MKRYFVFVISLFFVIACSGQQIKKIKITDLEKTITESQAPLIISFWATYCKPCLEEIPYFQEEVKKHEKDSMQLLLVSLDMDDYYPGKIKSFVRKHKFTVPVLWLDETNADYFCPKVDPKWSGAIPATLFVNNKKAYRKFVEEELTLEEFKKEIMAILE